MICLENNIEKNQLEYATKNQYDFIYIDKPKKTLSRKLFDYL